MDPVSSIKDLFAHMAWADSAVWKAVVGSEAARSDKALRDRLLHLHFVQHAFLSVWQGIAFNPAGAMAFDFDMLLDWTRTYHLEAHQFLGSVAASTLDQPMPVPWAQRAAERMGKASAENPTVGETMIHLTLHTAHHRGQVNTRLHELGVEPPLVDYIAWIWFGRPLPEWPEAGTSHRPSS